MEFIEQPIKPELRIVFKEHIVYIELSKEQRPKYFEYKNGNIKAGSKKLWKKCIDDKYKHNTVIEPHHLKLPYVVIGYKGNDMYSAYAYFDNNNEFIQYQPKAMLLTEPSNCILTKTQLKKKTKYYVTNIETGERVVANPTQVGKPKLHIIKGQDFYVGLFEHTRVKIVNELKDFYYENKFKGIKGEIYRERLNDRTPFLLHLNIYDTLSSFGASDNTASGNTWDVGNKGLPYIKTFSDFITRGYKDFSKILQDDDKLNIYGEYVEYTPVKTFEERKLVFTLYSNKFKKEQYNKIIEANEQDRQETRSKGSTNSLRNLTANGLYKISFRKEKN